MGKNVLFIFFIVSSLSLFGQKIEKDRAKIIGLIVDSASRLPIEHATISIKTNEGFVALGIVNKEGRFLFGDLTEGNYQLVCSAYGYKSQINSITISGNEKSKDAGTILLSANITVLKEVKVEGANIRQYIDRDVFIIDHNKFSNGSRATDVLRKINGLSVTPGGDVKVLGKSDPKVLVNGRSYDLSYIRSLPASSIKSVEVISMALPKFDAEGYSSVINIITTKNLIDGFNGDVYARIGTRDIFGSGVSARVKVGKVSLDAYYDYSSYFYRGNYNLITTSSKQTLIDRQLGKRTNDFSSHALTSNLLINLDTLNTFNFSVGVNSSRINRRYLTDYFTESNALSSTINSTSGSTYENYRLIAEYKRVLSKKKLDHSLTATTYYKKNNESLNQFIDQVTSSIKNNNTNTIYSDEFIAQVDYNLPIDPKKTFEAGAKLIRRKSLSSYTYLIDQNDGSGFRPGGGSAGEIDYLQQIGAAYASYNANLGFMSFLIGGRLETTILNSKGTNTSIDQDLLNFFPSLAVSKNWKQFGRLRLNYSRNIARPGIGYINPFVNNRDPSNITVGNANLRPEFGNALELTHSKRFKRIFISTSLRYNSDNGLIQSYIYPEQGILITQYQNIGSRKAYTIGTSMNYDVTDGFSITLNAFMKRVTNYDKLLDISTSGYNYSLDGTLSLNLGKGYNLNASAIYDSPKLTPQGTNYGVNMIEASLSKNIGKNISVNVIASDITNSLGLNRTKNTTSNGINQISETHFNNRAFKISAFYSFGKDFRIKRLSRKVNNSDLKELGKQ